MVPTSLELDEENLLLLHLRIFLHRTQYTKHYQEHYEYLLHTGSPYCCQRGSRTLSDMPLPFLQWDSMSQPDTTSDHCWFRRTAPPRRSA